MSEILTKINEVIDLVKEAQNLNEEMQKKVEPGSSEWHKYETIDDRLNDALCKLGD